MKLLALLCFIGLAAASAPTWQWQSGKEHIFFYSGRLLTGIPELASQYSGIGIKAEVIIQVKSLEDLRLTLKHVEFSHVNEKLMSPHLTGPEGSNWRDVILPGFTPASQEVKALLATPVVFSVKDGEIKAITVSGIEAEWSLNFKKALVVLFQTKMEKSVLDLEMNTISKESYETKNYWKVSEETIDGVCDVIYQVNELPEYLVKEAPEKFPIVELCPSQKYYEIVKTKDLTSCKKSAMYMFLKPSTTTPGCTSPKCITSMFGTASSVTRYYACGSRSNLILQSIINEGELAQKILGIKTESMITGTKQVLLLKEIKTIRHEIPLPAQPRTIESVMYEYMAKGEILREQIGLIPKLPQAELKNSIVYKYLPRQFLPWPSSQETKEKLSPEKVKIELKQLFEKVIREITEVEDLPEKQIPMKIMSIVRGFTLLKVEDIKLLYKELKVVYRIAEKKHIFQNIFFDSVAISGTTPAVIFLKDMIKAEEMSKVQAVTTLMLLPHHIITPTKEVFISLFELIQSEIIMKSHVLYNTAIISYSNLIQKVCLDTARKVNYPTAVFGEFCDPQSEIVVEKWIPFLTRELKTAKTADKRNLIVVALGILNHKDVIPTLLPVVESMPIVRPEYIPRFEFSYRNITRYLSVYALRNAGVKHPELVLPVVFSIFNNPAENTEIRIAAFNVMMSLNPPMVYLQKIASTTWSEKDMEVLKVIYTSISSIAQKEEIITLETSAPEISIVKKCQIILPLLKKIPGYMPSSGVIYSAEYLPLMESGYKSIFAWISNYKSFIPSDVYAKIEYLLGNFQFKPYEFAFKMHGFENIYQKFTQVLKPLYPEYEYDEEMKLKYKNLPEEEYEQLKYKKIPEYLKNLPEEEYGQYKYKKIPYYEPEYLKDVMPEEEYEQYKYKKNLYEYEPEYLKDMPEEEYEQYKYKKQLYEYDPEYLKEIMPEEEYEEYMYKKQLYELPEYLSEAEIENLPEEQKKVYYMRKKYFPEGRLRHLEHEQMRFKKYQKQMPFPEGPITHQARIEKEMELENLRLEKHVFQIKKQLHKEWAKVIDQLKIEVRENGPLSSLIYLNLYDDISFFGSITDITNQLIQEKITPLLKNPLHKMSKICGIHPINFQRIMNIAPSEFLIPSDMGFPIIIETQMPITLSLQGHIEVKCNVEKPVLIIDAKIMTINNFYGIVGTFSPMTKEMLVTGIKEDFVLNLPTRTHIMFDAITNEVKVNLKPYIASKPIDILYYKTLPFIAKKNVYSFIPITMVPTFKPIKTVQPLRKIELPFGTPLGLTFKSIIETETRYLDMGYIMQVAKMYNYNPLNMLRFFINPSISEEGLPSMRYHTYRLQYDPTTSVTKEVEMIFSLGLVTKKITEEPKYYNIRVKSIEELKKEKILLKKLIPYEIEYHPIAEQIHPVRQDILKKVIEKLQLKSGVGFTFLFKTMLKGARPHTFTYQVVLGAGTDVNMKQKWHILLESEPLSKPMVQKICIDGQAQIPIVPFWDIEMLRSMNLDFQFKNIIGFGKHCEESKIKIFGSSKVTPKQKIFSLESPIAKKCQKLIEKQVPGALTSKVCEETLLLAKTLDEIDFKLEYVNTPPMIKFVEIKLTEALKAFLWPYLRHYQTFTPTLAMLGENREVMVKLIFDKSINALDIILHKPDETVAFKNVHIPEPLEHFFPIVLGESNVMLGLEAMSGYSLIPKCKLEKSWLRTFDNRSLPLKMDDCFHLITGDCSPQFSFGVLARAIKHSQVKELKIFLNKTEVLLIPAHQYSTYLRDIKIKINETFVHLEKNMKKIIRDEFDDIVLELYRSKDSVIHLYAPKFYLDLKFDGERIAIESSLLLKNKLCGICGDLNNQKIADLRGPKKCIYSKPEVEIAAYRIQTPLCAPLEGHIKERLLTETKKCAKYHEIPTEVYKSFMALVGKCSRFEHMIMERAEEVCFSKIPVLQCGAQCSPKPRQLVSKKISFTCMKKGRIAELYREKVIQGLELPELKSKHESFFTNILLPQSCVSVIAGLPMVSNSGIPATFPAGSEIPSGNIVPVPVPVVTPVTPLLVPQEQQALYEQQIYEQQAAYEQHLPLEQQPLYEQQIYQHQPLYEEQVYEHQPIYQQQVFEENLGQY